MPRSDISWRCGASEQRPLVLRSALSLVSIDPFDSHDYSTRNAGTLASDQISPTMSKHRLPLRSSESRDAARAAGWLRCPQLPRRSMTRSPTKGFSSMSCLLPLLSFAGSGQEALVSLSRMRLVGEPHLAAAECRPGTASAGRVTTVRIGDETLDSGTAARASGPRRLVPFTLRMPQTKSQRIG